MLLREDITTMDSLAGLERADLQSIGVKLGAANRIIKAVVARRLMASRHNPERAGTHGGNGHISLVDSTLKTSTSTDPGQEQRKRKEKSTWL